MIKFFFLSIIIFLLSGYQTKEKSEQNVELLDSAAFEDLLAANKGNVFLVNIWATWCVPCVEEIPDLIKLADYYKNKDVKIIGISIDFKDEINSKIMPFVTKQKINFSIYVNDFQTDEEFINYFNYDWSGAIPATFVYDRQGNQKEFLLGKHLFDDFKNSIEQLL